MGRFVVLVCSIVTAMAMMLAAAPVASANEGATVTVVDASLAVGEMGTIDIVLGTGDTALAALTVELMIDSTIVAPVLNPDSDAPQCAVTAGSVDILACGPTGADTEVRVATIAISGFTDGTTISIDVVGAAPGDAVVGIVVETAADTQGQRVPAEGISGVISVRNEEPPEPVNVLLERLRDRVPAHTYERLEVILADKGPKP